MTHPITSILLTDDDPDDQLLFETALETVGRSVVFLVANDGIDALEQLRSAQTFPNIIFLDVNMPRMNGIDCLKELKADPVLRSIPVVMYSTSSYYRGECLSIGAVDYIEKPSDYNRLCTLLKDFIGNGIPISEHQPAGKV